MLIIFSKNTHDKFLYNFLKFFGIICTSVAISACDWNPKKVKINNKKNTQSDSNVGTQTKKKNNSQKNQNDQNQNDQNQSDQNQNNYDFSKMFNKFTSLEEFNKLLITPSSFFEEGFFDKNVCDCLKKYLGVFLKDHETIDLKDKVFDRFQIKDHNDLCKLCDTLFYLHEKWGYDCKIHLKTNENIESFWNLVGIASFHNKNLSDKMFDIDGINVDELLRNYIKTHFEGEKDFDDYIRFCALFKSIFNNFQNPIKKIEDIEFIWNFVRYNPDEIRSLKGLADKKVFDTDGVNVEELWKNFVKIRFLQNTEKNTDVFINLYSLFKNIFKDFKIPLRTVEDVESFENLSGGNFGLLKDKLDVQFEADGLDVEELCKVEDGKISHFNLDENSKKEDVDKFVKFCSNMNILKNCDKILDRFSLKIENSGKICQFSFDDIEFNNFKGESASSIREVCDLKISKGKDRYSICVNDQDFNLGDSNFVEFFGNIFGRDYDYEWRCIDIESKLEFKIENEIVYIGEQKIDLPFYKAPLRGFNENAEVVYLLKKLEDRGIINGFINSINFEIRDDGDCFVFGQSLRKNWGYADHLANALYNFLKELKIASGRKDIEIICYGDYSYVGVKIGDKKSENLLNSKK